MTRRKSAIGWIAPPAGPVYVVRWAKKSGREHQVAHRFFFEAYHARKLHAALQREGYHFRLYVTGTD